MPVSASLRPQAGPKIELRLDGLELQVLEVWGLLLVALRFGTFSHLPARFWCPYRVPGHRQHKGGIIARPASGAQPAAQEA